MSFANLHSLSWGNAKPKTKQKKQKQLASLANTEALPIGLSCLTKSQLYCIAPYLGNM